MLITWDANLYLVVLNFDTFLTVPYELKIIKLYYITKDTSWKGQLKKKNEILESFKLTFQLHW